MSKDKCMAVTSGQRIAERVVGQVDWLDEHEGYCECPGRARHTSTNAKRDCTVHLDGVPNLHCLHHSCTEETKSRSSQLRQALQDGGIELPEPSKNGRRETNAESLRHQLQRKRAANCKAVILKKYAWPYDRMIQESPVPVTDNVAEHGKLLLSRYADGDVIWIGDTHDTGRPEHAVHFKTKEEWLAQPEISAGPFICPAVFKNSAFSRSNANVLDHRFLVIESDTLDRDQVGAILKWMNDEVDLPLVAVVDTAGKSLHGWFEYPPENYLDELKIVLPQLGCDPSLFRPSQPVRLPGAFRVEKQKHQKLVFLKEVAQ